MNCQGWYIYAAIVKRPSGSNISNAEIAETKTNSIFCVKTVGLKINSYMTLVISSSLKISTLHTFYKILQR
jgi:hypothetical protein